MHSFRLRSVSLCAAVVVALAGCTVHPAGERAERQLNQEAGQPYERPPELRQLPVLPNDPTPDQLVTYALLSNADVEQSYWQWRSALEQIPQEGTQKTNLMITYSGMISNGTTAASMNALGVGSDPMNNIVLPDKLRTSGMNALESARAGGLRFDKARLELRNKVFRGLLRLCANRGTGPAGKEQCGFARLDRPSDSIARQCRRRDAAGRAQSKQ